MLGGGERKAKQPHFTFFFSFLPDPPQTPHKNSYLLPLPIVIAGGRWGPTTGFKAAGATAMLVLGKEKIGRERGAAPVCVALFPSGLRRPPPLLVFVRGASARPARNRIKEGLLQKKTGRGKK